MTDDPGTDERADGDGAALFDVVLTGVGEKKMDAIKAIRKHTRAGLRDTVRAVDSRGVIAQGVTAESAATLINTLEAVGGTAQRVAPGEGHDGDESAGDVNDDDPRIEDPAFRKLRGRVKKAVFQNLRADEQIKAVIRGAHGQAMIGAPTRVIVCKPGWMAGATGGAETTTWNYRNLAGVQVHKGLTSGSVILQGPGQVGTKTSYWGQGKDDPAKAPNAIPVVGDWGEVRQGAAKLQELIDDAHNQAAKPVIQAAAPAKSITDQLRELGELRDSGIIDDTEFRQLKQQLISGGS